MHACILRDLGSNLAVGLHLLSQQLLFVPGSLLSDLGLPACSMWLKASGLGSNAASPRSVSAARTSRGCSNMACQSVTGEGRAENGFRICNRVLLLYVNCDAIIENYALGSSPNLIQLSMLGRKSVCQAKPATSPERCQCRNVRPFRSAVLIVLGSVLLLCLKTPPSGDNQRPGLSA
jgi:hypothetical protein